MSKVFTLLMLAAMVIQIIKPLGLPGLKKRSDFWKLALIAIGAIGLTAALGHWG